MNEGVVKAVRCKLVVCDDTACKYHDAGEHLHPTPIDGDASATAPEWAELPPGVSHIEIVDDDFYASTGEHKP